MSIAGGGDDEVPAAAAVVAETGTCASIPPFSASLVVRLFADFRG